MLLAPADLQAENHIAYLPLHQELRNWCSNPQKTKTTNTNNKCCVCVQFSYSERVQMSNPPTQIKSSAAKGLLS